MSYIVSEIAQKFGHSEPILILEYNHKTLRVRQPTHTPNIETAEIVAELAAGFYSQTVDISSAKVFVDVDNIVLRTMSSIKGTIKSFYGKNGPGKKVRLTKTYKWLAYQFTDFKYDYEMNDNLVHLYRFINTFADDSGQVQVVGEEAKIQAAIRIIELIREKHDK